MDAARVPLFCGTELAERIELAEAELVATASRAAARRRGDTVGFAVDFAGGVASFAEDHSPFNKVAGIGFAGVPGVGQLAEVEREFAARGAPVQVELAHLADPAIAEFLTGRGYRLTSYENVLGFVLSGRLPFELPAGIEVRPSGADELPAWLELAADAVAHPDTQGVPTHEDFPREVVVNAMRVIVYVAGQKFMVAGLTAGSVKG